MTQHKQEALTRSVQLYEDTGLATHKTHAVRSYVLHSGKHEQKKFYFVHFVHTFSICP